MSLALALVVVAAGVGAGVLSALFGVGGGIVLVPFVVLVLDKSQHVAEGTSLLVIVPTALAGVLSLRSSKLVSFRHAGWVALGGIAGSALGALAALQISGPALRDGFSIFVIAMGVRLFWQSVKPQKSSPSTPTS